MSESGAAPIATLRRTRATSVWFNGDHVVATLPGISLLTPPGGSVISSNFSVLRIFLCFELIACCKSRLSIGYLIMVNIRWCTLLYSFFSGRKNVMIPVFPLIGFVVGNYLILSDFCTSAKIIFMIFANLDIKKNCIHN